MAVSFITRILMCTRVQNLVLGYAYPAYDCYKALELKTNQQVAVEQMRFWCQYWILVAVLRVADCAAWWLPMYGVAKMAAVVYLWHPRTRGAGRVYGAYLQPLLARHEAEIDRRLLDLTDAAASRLRAGLAVARARLLDAAGRRVSSE